MKLDMLETYLEFDEILSDLYAAYDWFHLKSPKSSITNIELFFIYCEIKRIKPQIIFESGVATGRSTAILASCMKPYGRIISAHFSYEECHLFPFNFANSIIVEGRGENAIKQIDFKSDSVLAVIDGPKPGGYLYGNTGWIQLMDELINIVELKGIFQHDVVGKGKEKFDAYFLKHMKMDFSYVSYKDQKEEFSNGVLEPKYFGGNVDSIPPSLVLLRKLCLK